MAASDNRILVLGLDVDPDVIHFVAHCRRRKFAIRVVNLREAVADGGWDIDVQHGAGALWTGTTSVDLTEPAAVFWRPIDLSPYVKDAAVAARWSRLIAALAAWLSGIEQVQIVVNRADAARHNKAKPLHEAVLQDLGFGVPEAVTSADRAVLQDFAAAGRTVAKGLTGKGISAREVTPSDLEEHDRSRGPIHLQRLVEGTDVRVHVVGDAVLALQIAALDVDYRVRGLRAAATRPFSLAEPLARRLLTATRLQGLAFAGWDLKFANDGSVWVLECNPMPAFAGYDRLHRGAVSELLLRHLAGEPAPTGRSDTRRARALPGETR